ncbi:hypothetical protein ACFQZ4_38275 [Catellatospora coxensis]
MLDDADDPADLDGLWPIGEHGRSIVTTRRRDAMVLRPAARVVRVGMFTGPESVDYLRNRLSLDPAAGHGAPPPDGELAGLAAALGHFPLALSQAAAFLIDTGTGVAAYRRLLDDERERLADLFPPSSPPTATTARWPAPGSWRRSGPPRWPSRARRSGCWSWCRCWPRRGCRRSCC